MTMYICLTSITSPEPDFLSPYSKHTLEGHATLEAYVCTTVAMHVPYLAWHHSTS